MSESAGGRLRAALDAALAREFQRCGQPLRWDEREQQQVDAVSHAAEHVEVLQQLLDEEYRRWEDGQRRRLANGYRAESAAQA